MTVGAGAGREPGHSRRGDRHQRGARGVGQVKQPLEAPGLAFPEAFSLELDFAAIELHEHRLDGLPATGLSVVAPSPMAICRHKRPGLTVIASGVALQFAIEIQQLQLHDPLI